MQKGLNLLFLFFIQVYCPSTYLHAQIHDNDGRSRSFLQVNSNPDGVLVKITGQNTFVGRTPFVIPYPVSGLFKVEAHKQGYEGKSTSVFLGRSDDKITLHLSKKTPFKAAIRSTVFPGWGQFYGQNKTKGVVVSLTQSVFGILTLLAVNEYNDARNEYEIALENFNRNQFSRSAAEIAFEPLQKELRQAQDALNFRNTMVYLTTAFWFYNIMDSFLFFSSEDSFIDIQSKGMGEISSISSKTVMVTMRIGL